MKPSKEIEGKENPESTTSLEVLLVWALAIHLIHSPRSWQTNLLLFEYWWEIGSIIWENNNAVMLAFSQLAVPRTSTSSEPLENKTDGRHLKLRSLGKSTYFAVRHTTQHYHYHGPPLTITSLYDPHAPLRGVWDGWVDPKCQVKWCLREHRAHFYVPCSQHS